MTARDCRLLLIALVSMAVLGAATTFAAAQPRELPAKIVTLSGRVEASRTSEPAWTIVKLRDELSAGDGVRTIAGRLVLRTGSGQALRLGARTPVFFMASDAGAAAGPTRVRMDGGLLWISATPNSPPSTHLEVRAGPVTVTVRGGGASIAMEPNGSVVVAVYHGAVSAAGEGWQRELVQDQQVLVPPTGAPKEIAKLKREKRDAEWVKWNEQQDKAGGFGARVEK
jgi:hypothetical protein